MYVALAEALDAVLVTTDRRLTAATGPACRIDATDAPWPDRLLRDHPVVYGPLGTGW
jgi:hypothetical protein